MDSVRPRREEDAKREDREEARDDRAFVEDLEAREAEADAVGGGTSNILKTRHDTSKNSISNVR